MIIKIEVTLDVNDRLWALEYEVTPRQVHGDVREYVKEAIEMTYAAQQTHLYEVTACQVIWP